ncbi:hypothetical protein H9L10_07265 [Phycicoccus endophyticus]|uniref:Cell division protein FtsL n=1 Tax=Phycicoccus endophyticus TaxID=1690220 RepID=A0A7G9R552_9MICO|nr:hypothetical protein [Phycicoccus endophyticus]NHI20673.1 hypothetical protein [Phycicoccus endophyticus]QNN50727.1 hypothetical protein H9L10_07265 [Phycicoccus endophyticus]GGL43629.1 hypothetical protein GCM10012283_27760 [Phycicoccus endophyticus]
MTQHATARPQGRPAPRRSGAPARRLRVVAQPAGAGSGLFLALCVALVLGGFVGVLVLNTAMAKGSFTMRDLQQRSDELADTQDDLQHDLDAVSGPGPLAREARALGMVPAQTAAFLRLRDGTVLGVATKATADETFSVVTESSTSAGSASAASPTTAPSR